MNVVHIVAQARILRTALGRGRAADFDDPLTFKQCFLDDLWTMAQEHLALRRYFASAVLADPTAMWELGRDARRRSINDEPGQAYRRIRPSLYYWSPATTVEAPSRPGEFHPEPLTDPDWILSHHPARATARRLPPSVECQVLPVAG